MLFHIKNPYRFLKTVVLITLAFTICCSFVLVLAQVKPFWVDEWRVIYNLKYKSPALLFGQLDYMQQFPRVYLALIKLFSMPFDYSYFTLRAPSFVVGVSAIILSYKLMKKIYPEHHLNRFLFVMVLVSSYTFTEYFIQIKQYTMDIFLSLVAIAQLIELLNLQNKNYPLIRYRLLATSCLIAPFFSYTYPIAIAPVFAIIVLQNISSGRFIARQWLCLGICAACILVFYLIDVAQLMRDKDMHNFWSGLIMSEGFDWQTFYVNFYHFFAEVGRGLVFSIIFAVLGIASFAFGLYKCAARSLKEERSVYQYILLYSVMLLCLVFFLFVAGKFPLGEPRLSVFAVPSVAILIIAFLDNLQAKANFAKYSKGISVVLYIGVIGNIYTTFISGVTGSEYSRTLDIYVATENAIIEAQAKRLPILITPGVAYPYENTQNLPFNTTVPGDWVLKTFPAYKVHENIPVYALSTLNDVAKCMKQLPPGVKAVMVGDGLSYRLITRQ